MDYLVSNWPVDLILYYYDVIIAGPDLVRIAYIAFHTAVYDFFGLDAHSTKEDVIKEISKTSL